MKPTSEQLAAMIVGMAELYGRTLTEDGIELYSQVIADYDVEQLRIAFRQVLRTHSYATLPTPAEFVQAIETPEDAESKALVAWEKVFSAVKAYSTGPSRWPEIHDDVARATVASFGGWYEFWELWAKHDAEKFATITRAQFIKAYLSLSASPVAVAELASKIPVKLLAAPAKQTESVQLPERRQAGQPTKMSEIIADLRKENPKLFEGWEDHKTARELETADSEK